MKGYLPAENSVEMSRSVHTRPDRIRAADRARFPLRPRDDHARNRWFVRRRELKEQGVVLAAEAKRRVSPGMMHLRHSRRRMLDRTKRSPTR